MPKKLPLFLYPTCTACGICDEACPFSCIAMGHTGVDGYKKVYPLLASAERCTGCALCKKACPVDAIAMQENPA